MSDEQNISHKTTILDIPLNVLLTIFRYLDLKSLCLATRVCRSWHCYANDPSLWKILDLSAYQYTARKLKKIINTRTSSNTRELHIKGVITATKKLVNLSIPLFTDIKNRAPDLLSLSLRCCYLKSIDITSLPGSIKKLDLSQSLVPLGWFDTLKTNNILPFLQTLDISLCSRISSEAITNICHLPALKYLKLRDCYRIVDEDIRNIGIKLRNIVHLDISGCKKLTDASMSDIATYLKHLENLYIRNCHLITPLGLISLRDGLNKLEVLDLVGCSEKICSQASMIFSNCENLVINTLESNN